MAKQLQDIYSVESYASQKKSVVDLYVLTWKDIKKQRSSNVSVPQNHLLDLLKPRLLDPHPQNVRFSRSGGEGHGGQEEFVFLNKSQVIMILLVWGPQIEDNCSKT